MQKRHLGFTLIEMVVTLALLGVLAMLAAPMAEAAVTRSREQALRQALREIRDAIDQYRRAVDTGQITRVAGRAPYPPTLEVLVTGVPGVQAQTGGQIYFLRRLPRDPFYPDATTPAARTWGLRSYASPPDEPQEGDDVFDVYSKSEALGMNGIPYKEW